MRSRALAIVVLAWAAPSVGCGAEPDGAVRTLSTSGDASGVLVIPGRDPPPLQPSPSPSASPRDYTRLGEPESRGHREEARDPGVQLAEAPVDDGVCSYVCQGLRACATVAPDGTCDLCPARVPVRDDCRVFFTGLQRCLTAFDCNTVSRVGLDQLLAGCGVDSSVLDACSKR